MGAQVSRLVIKNDAPIMLCALKRFFSISCICGEKNFSHSAHEKSEAKMAEIDLQYL